MSQTEKQIITTQILPKNLRNEGNETIKFCTLIQKHEKTFS